MLDQIALYASFFLFAYIFVVSLRFLQLSLFFTANIGKRNHYFNPELKIKVLLYFIIYDNFFDFLDWNPARRIRTINTRAKEYEDRED